MRLPVSVLRDFSGLIASLPDDRYAVYLIIVRGTHKEKYLVREFFVRDGKPVERDEIRQRTDYSSDPSGGEGEERGATNTPSPQMQGERATTLRTDDSRPPNARHGSEDLAPALPGSGAADDAPASVELGEGQSLPNAGLVAPSMGGSLAMVIWHKRVDEAIEKHSNRLRTKAERRYRRRRRAK